MSAAIVRRAAAEDADALVELRAEMFAAMGVTEADAGWRDEARAWFTARVGDPAYGIFVVVEDGAVVACAMAAIRDAAPSPAVPAGRDVLISNVCTRVAARGRGHGGAAFAAALGWARSTGVGRAELMATAQGRSMYERAGFTATTFPAMRALL